METHLQAAQVQVHTIANKRVSTFPTLTKIETVYGSRTPLKIKYEVSNLKKSPPLQKIKNTQPRRPTLHRQRW